MRAFVYVDGFNVYYRALKSSRHKWLNLDSLARRLLKPGDTVDLIRYFTARVSRRSTGPDTPRRQQIYLGALQTLPNLEIHYGRFLPKTKHRPLASNPSKFVEVLDTEEKGSDVNLAVHLVNDAWHDRFDIALVMSQDTDLIEPIKIVSRELGKTVVLVWLDGRQPSHRLASAATYVRHARSADFSASLFPNPLPRAGKAPLNKPQGW